jgi:hypothetical protein
MPTLLRFALIALSNVVLLGGIAIVSIGVVADGSTDAGRLLLGTFSVCALVLPLMIAGVFASYWSWDAAARRRLRVSTVILVAIQVAGAAGLIAGGAPVLPAVVLVVVTAALDPASVALGRAARRIELRRPAPDGDLAEFRARIRVGWRRGGIGAVIGLAIGVVLTVLLLSFDLHGAELLRALVFLPAGVGLGTSIGMVTVVLGLAKRVRDLLGGDYSSARRIGRAVNGKPEQLSEEEVARATRYASVAPEWVRLQTTQALVNSLAVLSIAASSLAGLADDGVVSGGWIGGILAVALLITIGTTLWSRLVQLRRVRAWAAAHPFPV